MHASNFSDRAGSIDETCHWGGARQEHVLLRPDAVLVRAPDTPTFEGVRGGMTHSDTSIARRPQPAHQAAYEDQSCCS